MMRLNEVKPTIRLNSLPRQQVKGCTWQESRSSAAARGLSARMAIFDLPLKASLFADTSQPIGMITLKRVLICYCVPTGANSILTLELMSDIQLSQDLSDGDGSSSLIHRRQMYPFTLRASCLYDNAYGYLNRGVGKLPQTQGSIAVRSATCLTCYPLLFPPSPLGWVGFLKVWGCAPLRTHPSC